MSLCNVPIFMEHFHKKVFKDTSCSSIDQQWVGDLQDMWGGVWKGGSVEVWKGEGELFRSLLWQSTVIFCCPGHFFVAVQCSDAVEVAHPTVILLLSALIVIEWKELDASSSPSIENFAVKIPFQSPPTSTWRKNSTDCEKTRASLTSPLFHTSLGPSVVVAVVVVVEVVLLLLLLHLWAPQWHIFGAVWQIEQDQNTSDT